MSLSQTETLLLVEDDGMGCNAPLISIQINKGMFVEI
jgi:hypothetical protein